ncbi:MAG: GGDEF domain-containing protein [Psychrobium sp.]
MANFKENESIIPNLFEGELTALYVINGIACIFFFSFAIRNFYLENYYLATSLTAYIGYSLIASYILFKDRTQQTHVNICVALLLLALYFMVEDWGMGAVYWFYPIVIGLVFILPPRISVASNGLIFFGVSYTAVEQLPMMEAVRLIMALLLTNILSYLINAHITRLHRAIKQESIRDPLTGALNRRQLDIHLTQSRNIFERERKPACILMIDIDHFKSINDNFGHDVGDQVIISLVDLINTHCRKQDLLFRVGGEEFVLLLPSSSQQDAIFVANKIKSYLNSTKLIANYSVSASIGIAELGENINSTAAWLKQADNYMYQAKQTGRDRICYAVKTS